MISEVKKGVGGLALLLIMVFAYWTEAAAQDRYFGVCAGGGVNTWATFEMGWSAQQSDGRYMPVAEGIGASDVALAIGWTKRDIYSGATVDVGWRWQGEMDNGYGWETGFGLSAVWRLWQVEGSYADALVGLHGVVALTYRSERWPVQFVAGLWPRVYALPQVEWQLGVVGVSVRIELD